MEVIIKYAKTPDREIVLPVRPSDRILYIKGKIAEQLPIDYYNMNLSKDDVPLLDDCTLSECNIGNHSVLDLNKFDLVTINMKDGKQFYVNVSPDDRISDLKNYIFKNKGIPTNDQTFIIAGARLCEEEDNSYLSDWCVKHNSTIHLVIKPK